MNIVVRVVSVFLLVNLVIAPPPRRNDLGEKKPDGSQDKDEIEDFGLEYNRYLKEVIDLLESDPDFKRKLEDAQEADIRNGQIARELEFVDHKVRTKLDEVKRQEIERLRHLAQKQNELFHGIETEHVKISSEHLDHKNPITFEMEDLKKLIAKVSADLSEADEKRRQEFKEYEMQKEFEKQQKLKHLEGSEREAFEQELKENETKHKQHEPLHHPGSKQQLEEVWEKQDHMENQEFNPKIFFQLHDLDGNGFWDHNEVKTLFLKELDKMYKVGAPEDDMKERVEEMERMREHVFSEADKNKDGLISYDEFIDKTRQPDFEKDSGWESLDQKSVFTPEEYLEFEKRRQEEVQRMIQQGLIPPQPVFHPGQHPQVQYAQYHPPQYQAYPSGHPHFSQGQPSYRYAQDYSNGFPQGYPNQQGQGGGPPNPPHQAYPNQQGQSGGLPNPPHQAYPNQQNAGFPNQPYPNQQGGGSYPSQQGLPNPPHQSYPNPNIRYQSAQGIQNQPQPQRYEHPQGQQQVHHQTQLHHNQPGQGYNQPQENKNQPQGYQQAHQSQPLNHQQPQQNQVSPASMSDLQQKNAPSVDHQKQGSQASQTGHDPNEIRPINPQEPDTKYSKDSGNLHPNVIDLQQKKTESSEHQQKF